MPKLDEETQRARRDNILNAAEQCFSTQGFHSTAMHDICRTAGISPGTLYLYFSSKEDLIAAICERERTAFAQALAAVGDAPDFMAALKQLGDAYCLEQPVGKLCFQIEINAEALRNPAIGKTVRETDAFIIENFTRIIDAAHKKGRINPKINPVILAQILNIIGDGIFLRRALDPDFNVKQCMDVILSLLGSVIQPVETAEPDTEPSQEVTMRRPSKSLLSGAVITALAALSAYAGSATVARAQTTVAEAALSTEPDAGPAVNVIAVKKSEFAETILVTGSLAAREQVLVSAQIEGYRIEEIFVEEGDKVTAGQILAKLADGTLKAQLAQIKATLTRSEAAIAQARSQILQAEATKKQADAAFERAKQLLQSRAGSQATYDDKEAAARNAAAGLALARDGLLVAEAAKVETEAQIAESELRLGYTQIKAPKAGMISRRNVKLGTLASAAAEPLFHIVANSEIELEAEVPEIYLPRLAIGQIAKISVAGLPAVTGSLRLISPEVDRSTRLGKVRILIGEGDQLRIGAFARATINTARKDGLGVPETAILNREGNQTVLIVKDGHVETRRVEIGIRNGSRVEILDGLKDGELVVVRSGALLRNGDAVRPIVANENARSEAL